MASLKDASKHLLETEGVPLLVYAQWMQSRETIWAFTWIKTISHPANQSTR